MPIAKSCFLEPSRDRRNRSRYCNVGSISGNLWKLSSSEILTQTSQPLDQGLYIIYRSQKRYLKFNFRVSRFFIYLSCPLCLLACRAATKALHSRLSLASLWTGCQVRLRLFSKSCFGNVIRFFPQYVANPSPSSFH